MDALTLMRKLWSEGIDPPDYPKVVTLVLELGAPAQSPAPAPAAVKRRPAQTAPRRSPARPKTPRAGGSAPSKTDQVRQLLAGGPHTSEQIKAAVPGLSNLHVTLAQIKAKSVGTDPDTGMRLYALESSGPAAELLAQD